MRTKDTHRVDEVSVGPLTAFANPKTTDERQALREQMLDRLHQALENDQHPEEPVTLTAFRRDGKRFAVHLPSLRDRKRNCPSVERRRKLLSFQLADFIAASEV